MNIFTGVRNIFNLRSLTRKQRKIDSLFEQDAGRLSI